MMTIEGRHAGPLPIIVPFPGGKPRCDPDSRSKTGISGSLDLTVRRGNLANISTTEQVAHYINTTEFADFDAAAIHRAKALFLSCLGMSVAGSRLHAGRILAEYVRGYGATGKSGVAGAGFSTTAELATLANATAAHSTELEDDSWPESMYTCHIIPAMFALGQELGASGKAVLEAFIIGYEVQARPGMILTDGGATERGNLAAPHLGTIGVAAGAAKLLGLDIERTIMAISLAVSQASGSTRQMGTGAHLYEAGVAGRNGITAAKLAALGLTGEARILEGPKGYFDALAGHPHIEFTLGVGSDLRMMQIGFKKFTACYLMQRIIDGVTTLAKLHDIKADDVDKVVVEVNPTFPEIIKFPAPADGDEARFSLHHAIAAALSREEITIETFSDQGVLDPALIRHWNKTEIIVNPAWPRGIMGEHNPVTIRMKDGTSVFKDCVISHGDPEDPLTDAEVRQKYMSCCHGILSRETSEKGADLIMNLDRLNNVDSVMEILTFA
jgi:2-methylcitrate dehydratase PrpD